MKRVFTLLLAVVIICSLAITAYAADGSVTIQTTVYSQPPTWTLSIPSDIYIPYQQTTTEIGVVAIKNINNPSNAMAYIDVTLNYDPLRTDNGYNTIPLDIKGFQVADSDFYPEDYFDNLDPLAFRSWYSGQTFPYNDLNMHSAVFNYYYDNRTYPVYLTANIDQYSWNNAAPGRYATTLNFNAELTYLPDTGNNW